MKDGVYRRGETWKQIFFSLIKTLQQHWRARHIHLLPFITPLIPAIPHLYLPFSLFLFGFIGLWSGRTMRPPPPLLSICLAAFHFIYCLFSFPHLPLFDVYPLSGYFPAAGHLFEACSLDKMCPSLPTMCLCIFGPQVRQLVLMTCPGHHRG